MRYIRAGGCGIFGLSCLFALFAMTSTIVLLANWWLGRWSNSERIRYSLNNSTDNCSSNRQSKIGMMSNNEWFAERDKFFYVLLGKSRNWIIEMEKNSFFLLLGLSLLSVVLLFIRTMAYFVSCHLTARALHNQMFNALLRAPVLFFDSNPIGKKKNLD